MAGIAESALGSSLADLIKHFSFMALDEICKVPELPDNIDWLKEELDTITAVLIDLSDEENIGAQMKLWRNKQIELMYDMEDTLNNYILLNKNRDRDRDTDRNEFLFDVRDSEWSREWDREWNKDRDNTLKATIGKFQSKIKSIQKLPTKYRIANEIEKLKDRYKKCGRQPKRLKMSDMAEASVNRELEHNRALAIHAFRPDLVAVDEPSERIIRLLEFDSEELHKAVFIVGGGGLGKTTLAGHVFNTVKSGTQFQCSASVIVTRKPDIKNILIHILLGFGYKKKKINELKLFDDIKLTELLRGHIENKRYFLVVDDIWDDSPWNYIKAALFNNTSGGRMIVTTRKRDVANKCSMNLQHFIHDIEPLSEMDARDLLVKVFPNRKCPPVLREPFDKILKKCGGLPLAIKTVSGLLIDKVTPKQWYQVYHSLYSVDADPEVDVMRRIFSLSYYGLPRHLRPCLLYFSIFPEGKQIKRKRLIARWAAERLVDTEQMGNSYFDDLIKSSLIQPEKIKYDGEARACRVHDIILHYIVSKSVEENFVALQLGDNSYIRSSKQGRKIRRLSVHNSNEDHYIKLDEDLSHVRSFTAFGKIEKSLEGPHENNGYTSALRVLDLEDATIRDHWPVPVSQHLLLKYLSLPVRQEKEAPYYLHVLENLETLRFGGSVHEYGMSIDITNFRRLVRLFVDNFVELPDEINSLVALEELKGFNVCTQSLEFLQNLCKLQKLKVLGLHWEGYSDRDVADKENLLISSLRKLLGKHLESISIEIGLEFNEVNPDIDQWFDRNADYSNLLKFCTTELCVPRIPGWLSSEMVKNIQKLRLCTNELQQKDLDTLGSLDSLLYLSLGIREYFDLDDEDNDVDSLVISKSNGFKSLRHFCFQAIYMRTRFILFQGSRPMPRLQQLEFYFDPSCTMQASGQFDFGIGNLSHVPMIKVKIAYNFGDAEEKELASKAEEAIQTAVNSFSNRPTAKIIKEHNGGWWGYNQDSLPTDIQIEKDRQLSEKMQLSDQIRTEDDQIHDEDVEMSVEDDDKAYVYEMSKQPVDKSQDYGGFHKGESSKMHMHYGSEMEKNIQIEEDSLLAEQLQHEEVEMSFHKGGSYNMPVLSVRVMEKNIQIEKDRHLANDLQLAYENRAEDVEMPLADNDKKCGRDEQRPEETRDETS